MRKLLHYVGLDVGGTSMKAGVVDDSGKALSNISLLTEPDKGQEHGLATMCASVRLAAKEAGLSMSEISAIGVATPGTMDLAAGVMLEPPNMKTWRNVRVRDHVASEFGLPTAFQNDANAAALGEYWVGAGQHVRSLVFFTLGTGVGGGIIIHDRVLEGEHSHGAELGHMKIEMTNPRLCGCGKRGCLEAYASATAVVQRAEEAILAGQSSSLSMRQKLPNGLSARDIFDAAAAGDALAKRIVEETAFYLAMGATNAMHTIDPEMVVFGGGMIAAGDEFLQSIRRYVQELAFPVPAERTEIRFAQLGSDAGFIGAAACARNLLRGIKN
jgi:glucokinase